MKVDSMRHEHTQQIRHALPTRFAGMLAIGMLWLGQAEAGQALAQRHSCVACHQPAAKGLGPSWKDIGSKYGQGQVTAAQLAASIKRGSSGKWGAIPMPPQARVPDADAQAIAQWLLDGAK